MILTHDIQLLALKAKSFPEGIQEAFDSLHVKVNPQMRHSFYGLSWMEKGEMVYFAAILTENIAEKEELTPFTLKAGEFYTLEIKNWAQNIDIIRPSFMKLYENDGIDYSAPAIEHYLNENDVMLMVRKKDKE